MHIREVLALLWPYIGIAAGSQCLCFLFPQQSKMKRKKAVKICKIDLGRMREQLELEKEIQLVQSGRSARWKINCFSLPLV